MCFQYGMELSGESLPFSRSDSVEVGDIRSMIMRTLGR